MNYVLHHHLGDVLPRIHRLRNYNKNQLCLSVGRDHNQRDLQHDALARKIIIDISYDSSEKGFDGNLCGVLVTIAKQSGDIAMGVNNALETRDEHNLTEEEVESIGVGDRLIMFSFASNESPTFMPLLIYLQF